MLGIVLLAFHRHLKFNKNLPGEGRKEGSDGLRCVCPLTHSVTSITTHPVSQTLNQGIIFGFSFTFSKESVGHWALSSQPVSLIPTKTSLVQAVKTLLYGSLASLQTIFSPATKGFFLKIQVWSCHNLYKPLSGSQCPKDQVQTPWCGSYLQAQTFIPCCLHPSWTACRSPNTVLSSLCLCPYSCFCLEHPGPPFSPGQLVLMLKIQPKNHINSEKLD